VRCGPARGSGKICDGVGMKDYPCVAHSDDSPVLVRYVHDYSFIPSTRTLTEIIREAVQHGVDFPTHGEDCSCMDNLVREVRLQVNAALPIKDLEAYTSSEKWEKRFSAQMRAKLILNRAGTHL
jgi:hypothetical protein